MAYHSLTSEKYLVAVLRQEIKDQKRQRSYEISQIMRNCFLALVVTVAMACMIRTMPNWLPAVFNFMEYYGIIPTQFPV